MTNSEQQAIKDLLALFVVFNQLKRVADQAKNICEETVFAVTGEQKAPKVYNILFIDEDNSCLSQMAEAIASNQYPESGCYRSAGRNPAQQLDATLVSFLKKRGIVLADKSLAALGDLTHRDLAEQHVIVSLQGPVQSYISSVPFHSTALEWDLGPAPEAGNEQRIEELYREIALQIKDLMELLRGEGAS
jgi:phosphate transport system protein